MQILSLYLGTYQKPEKGRGGREKEEAKKYSQTPLKPLFEFFLFFFFALKDLAGGRQTARQDFSWHYFVSLRWLKSGPSF